MESKTTALVLKEWALLCKIYREIGTPCSSKFSSAVQPDEISFLKVGSS